MSLRKKTLSAVLIIVIVLTVILGIGAISVQGASWYSKIDFTAATQTLGTSNTGIIAIEYDVTPLIANTDTVIGYTDSSTSITGYSSMNMLLALGTDGTFTVRNGANYAADSVLSYSVNTTYHVKMEADLSTKLYSVWIGSTKIADKYAFRSDAPAIDDVGKICMRAAYADNTVKVDNHFVMSNTWYSKMDFAAGVHLLGETNTGNLTINFDVTPLAGNSDTVIGYSDSSTLIGSGGYPSLNMAVRLNDQGTFDVRSGADYAADATVSYSTNTTYHVKIEANLPSRLYSIWIGSTKIADNYSFRSDSPAIDDLGKICLRSAYADNVIRVGNHQVQALVTPTPTPTPTPVQLLYEDFEDNTANGWTVVDGNWDIITDGTKVYHSQITDSLSRVVVGDTAWDSYSVQVNVKTNSWNGGVVGNCGILARYTDINNYIIFNFSNGELRIKKQVAGVFTLLASKAYTQNLNTWYTLKAELSGSTLKLYVNGNLELSAYDGSLTAGKAGLIASAGDTRFDNFTVTQIIPPPPSNTVEYGYIPPAQTVHGGADPIYVPAGYIHQTAWAETGGSGGNLLGVFTYPANGWYSMVWRWADTMRLNSIQAVTAPGGKPAYRFELTPNDHASPGTAGDHPRAEFFSVDAAEDRREYTPPRDNIIRQGDEYWASFSLYLATDFPLNHRWATLVQRKFQNNVSNPPPWFGINVHKNTLDYSLPCGVPDDYRFLANVSDIRGRWIQITIHEKASAYSDGLFELYMDGVLKDRKTGATIQEGDINYNFHLGYYRANEPADGETYGPGTGVIYETPLIMFRGSNPGTIPSLP